MNNTPALSLSTSERQTLRYIAEGQVDPRELDWLALPAAEAGRSYRGARDRAGHHGRGPARLAAAPVEGLTTNTIPPMLIRTALALVPCLSFTSLCQSEPIDSLRELRPAPPFPELLP